MKKAMTFFTAIVVFLSALIMPPQQVNAAEFNFDEELKKDKEISENLKYQNAKKAKELLSEIASDVIKSI